MWYSQYIHICGIPYIWYSTSSTNEFQKTVFFCYKGRVLAGIAICKSTTLIPCHYESHKSRLSG